MALLAGLGIRTRLAQADTLRFPIMLTLASAVAVLLLALGFREPRRRLPHALEDEAGHHASSVTGAYAFVIRAGRWLLGSPVALFVVCTGFVHGERRSALPDVQQLVLPPDRGS